MIFAKVRNGSQHRKEFLVYKNLLEAIIESRKFVETNLANGKGQIRYYKDDKEDNYSRPERIEENYSGKWVVVLYEDHVKHLYDLHKCIDKIIKKSLSRPKEKKTYVRYLRQIEDICGIAKGHLCNLFDKD